MPGLRCGGLARCLHPALHVLTPVHVKSGSHKCTAPVKDPMHGVACRKAKCALRHGSALFDRRTLDSWMRPCDRTAQQQLRRRAPQLRAS